MSVFLIFPAAAFLRPEARVPFTAVDCEFPDLASLCLALAEGQLVCGSELISRKGAGAERVVIRRKPLAFTLRYVAKIENASVAYVEEDAA